MRAKGFAGTSDQGMKSRADAEVLTKTAQYALVSVELKQSLLMNGAKPVGGFALIDSVFILSLKLVKGYGKLLKPRLLNASLTCCGALPTNERALNVSLRS